MKAELSPELRELLKRLKQLAALPLSHASALPGDFYTSEALLSREREKIFNQQWLCAGRSDCLLEVGDYLTYHIGKQPIAIVRQENGGIRAFANVCRHRMMQLLEDQGSCPRGRITCPYHAWTYALDGTLVAAPHMNNRPEFNKSEYTLPSVRCEEWQGWVYVTLSPDVESIGSLLMELGDVVFDYKMSDYVSIFQEDHVWNTNWKLLTENFMEGYHLPVAHRATLGSHFPVKETQFSRNPPNPCFTYQYFTKKESALVGNAHPDNTHLKGDKRRTSILPTVFPSHMFSLAPDHLWYLSLQPVACDRVHIRYGAALAPEVLAASDNPERLKTNITNFLADVNAEDKFVVEGIFKGAQAPLSKAGPLCWLERENHEFIQYLARQLGPERRSKRSGREIPVRKAKKTASKKRKSASSADIQAASMN